MTNSATETLPAQQLDNLISLYIAILGRTPDSDGLNYWASEITAGFTIEQVATHMWGSAETRFFYPSDMPTSTIVGDIYRNVLDREPDEEGLDFWTGIWQSQGPAHTIQEMIHAVTRYVGDAPDAVHGQQVFSQKMDIAKYFVSLNLNNPTVGHSALELCDGTAEGLSAGKLLVDICARSGALYESYQHIAALYVGMYGRAPTEGELQRWTAQGSVTTLDQMSEIAARLMFSSEFTQRIGSTWSHEYFVELTYRAFGGTDGEAEGVAFWTAELSNDTLTRSELLAKFAYEYLHTDLSAMSDLYESGRITANELQETNNRINQFSNKVDVAISYALQVGNAGNIPVQADKLYETNYVAAFDVVAGVTADLDGKRTVLSMLNNVTLSAADVVDALDGEAWISSGGYRVITYGYDLTVYDDFPSGGILEQRDAFFRETVVNVIDAASHTDDVFRLEFNGRVIVFNRAELIVPEVEKIIIHSTLADNYASVTQHSLANLNAPQAEEVYLIGDVGVTLHSNLPLMRLLDASGISGEGYRGKIIYQSRQTSGDITLVGGAGDDDLSANERFTGQATLIGNVGKDSLVGGMGDDILSGGDGNDRLRGTDGADTLTGGSGSDDFVVSFGDSNVGAADVITDFHQDQGDVLRLYPYYLSTSLNKLGQLKVNLLTTTGEGIQDHIDGVANTTDDEVGFVFDPTSHMLYGDQDGDGTIDMQIALFGVTALSDTSIRLSNDSHPGYSSSGVVNQIAGADSNVVAGYSNDVFGSP